MSDEIFPSLKHNQIHTEKPLIVFSRKGRNLKQVADPLQDRQSHESDSCKTVLENNHE